MPGKRGRAKTVRVKKAKGAKVSKGKGRGKAKLSKLRKTTKAVTTPTGSVSSGVVRNTLAATRKRVASRYRITSRNPLD